MFINSLFSKARYILIGRVAAKRKAPLQSYMERDSSGRRGWSVSLTGQVAGQILGGSSETLAQTVGEPLQPGSRARPPRLYCTSLQGGRYHLSLSIAWKCGHHTESIAAAQTGFCLKLARFPYTVRCKPIHFAGL